ncbi:MAG TPA: DUF3300 domain-containing protein [Terriglobales bacterium]|nr:DUF3300 domain-containing protein [Terriglobales bacterium]
MIWSVSKEVLSSFMSCVLVCVTTTSIDADAQESSTPSPTYSGQGLPLTAPELQGLVAPIALYPDALVAQILSAATYTDQIAIADYWLQQHKNLTGNGLVQAVDKQSWDPSVKALTQFPSVLGNMAKNLSWTSSLGEAYHNQAPAVMSAVQTLRAQAKEAGNLNSGSQITVVQQSPQTIVIQPTNPEVVYVPQYNPAVVYGTPYATPGYTTADVVATGVLAFGAGIAVGAMMSGGCCGWGWSSWNCNWHGGAAYYGAHPYYGNAAWHGGYYGGGYSAYGPYGSAHYGTGYNPSTGTYARGASANTPYGSQKVGQAYNPSSGAYGATHQGSNAYSNWGSSTVSKNGQAAYTQHYSNADGSVGSVQTSSGGRAVASSTAYGNTAVGKTGSGNEYAAHNGTAYQNTGSGWEKNSGAGWSDVNKPSGSSSWGGSEAARGWGGRDSGGTSSAFGGSGSSGWGSRTESSRGWASRGGGGGWGGGDRGGGGFRR